MIRLGVPPALKIHAFGFMGSSQKESKSFHYYAAPINQPIRYLLLYKNEPARQHRKSPRAEAGEGKWGIKLLVLNYRCVDLFLQHQEVSAYFSQSLR